MCHQLHFCLDLFEFWGPAIIRSRITSSSDGGGSSSRYSSSIVVVLV